MGLFTAEIAEGAEMNGVKELTMGIRRLVHELPE